MGRIDDGRRKMPKLYCPYCSKRFGDVPNKEIKNISQLLKRDYISANDFILECPHCHNFVGLRISNIQNVCSHALV